MKKHITITIFLLVGCFITMSAQVRVYFSNKLDAPTLEAKGLNADQQKMVLSGLTESINKYMKYGKLLNPKTKQIDRESVANFKSLFTVDARVFNDLREVPESFLWDIDDYIEKARAYFPDYGVNFGIRNAEITSIEYDSRDAYYTFIIKASKSIERFYTAEGDVERGTQTHDLDFIYTFKLDRLDNIKISIIRGVAGKTPDVYTRIIGGGAEFGLGKASFTETDLFNKAGNTGTLDIKNNFNFNVQGNLYTNFFAGKKNPNKRLFLAVGASLGIQKITGELQDYSTSGTLSVNGEIPNNQVVVTEIGREATDVNIDEIQTRIIAKAPIGIGFRLLNNNTNSFFIKAQWVPSYALSSIKNELQNGTGDYAIDISDYNFNSSDNNAYDDSDFAQAYNIGDDKSINAKPTIATKFSHGVQLSVMFLKDFIDDSPTWGIAIGGHYYLPLSDLWTYDLTDANAIDKPFLYANDEVYTRQGVLQPFAEKARLSTFGISITIYRKTNRQP